MDVTWSRAWPSGHVHAFRGDDLRYLRTACGYNLRRITSEFPPGAETCPGCEKSVGSRQTESPVRSDSGSASVAVVLAVCIFGALLFLALLVQGQRAMCATHHNQLRYCPGYSAGERSTP